jgi:hypothetical protein
MKKIRTNQKRKNQRRKGKRKVRECFYHKDICGLLLELTVLLFLLNK